VIREESETFRDGKTKEFDQSTGQPRGVGKETPGLSSHLVRNIVSVDGVHRRLVDDWEGKESGVELAGWMMMMVNSDREGFVSTRATLHS
jgi:hypothetical protein